MTSYLRNKIEQLKTKAKINKIALDSGFSSYDLYVEDISKKEDMKLYLKVASINNLKDSYERFFKKMEDMKITCSLKVDRTPFSLHPGFILQEIISKLQKDSSFLRNIGTYFKKKVSNKEIRGAILRVKGKVNTLRTKTKIYKEGKINYTGSYLKDYLLISQINHSTSKGVIGLKLKIYYNQKVEKL